MRKTIKWLVIVIVLCTSGFLITGILKKNNSNLSSKQKRSVLPEAPLLDLDSLRFDLSSIENKPLVLIHFNSECDHCQYEAKDIKKNVEGFSGVNLIFMSSEPISRIEAFSREYGLSNYGYVHFAKTNSEHSVSAFGALTVPHVLVYGPDKILMKEFQGETSAAIIIKYLSSL